MCVCFSTAKQCKTVQKDVHGWLCALYADVFQKLDLRSTDLEIWRSHPQICRSKIDSYEICVISIQHPIHAARLRVCKMPCWQMHACRNAMCEAV
jgi:hypothetical protein